MLNSKAFKLLKLISRCPLPKNNIPEKFKCNNEIEWLLEKQLIAYGAISEDGESQEPFKITFRGKEYIAEKLHESKRHWQTILIPHPLNIFVSIVSAILTVIVMKHLGLIS